MGTCDAGRGLTEPKPNGVDSSTIDMLRARLEALTARLDEQAERVAKLEAENASQTEEIARMKAAPVRPASLTATGGAESKVGRRDMLRKVVEATAAAAVLTVAKDAATAQADTRTTLIAGGASTSSYGLATTYDDGGVDPLSFLPNLNGHQFGVIGVSADSGILSPAGAGVFGSGGTTNSGVLGLSGGGFGVTGQSTNNVGVYGQSSNNHGCGGATLKAGYSGLFGYTGTPGASALLGVSAAANGTAGYFHGAVFVDGSFQVMNGPKNALVAHPDGSHRRMYCQESPEPWFEDFGTAQLQAGKATVRLDPDFAAVVKADDYEVFPAPKGECKGLYVANQTPTSFDVRELQGGTSSIPFSYRLVARRKDDVGKRMEKVDLPKFDLTDPTTRHNPPGQDKERPR